MTERRLPADPRLREVVDFYETIQPALLPRIAQLYSTDAFFKDPFNEVRGRAAIGRIFEHMFRQVDEPRFEIGAAAVEGDLAFLEWTMSWRGRGKGRGRAAGVQTIRGSSVVRFDADGRICWHRDYWDAAGELYEKVPVLGALMRALRRRLAA